MATPIGGTALAERPTEWLPAQAAPRRAALGDALPAVRAGAYLHRIARLPEGVLSGLPGAVTSLGVSRDGTRLVAAHDGRDAVSVIDTATLSVVATGSDIAEPSAVVVSDRAYLRSASLDEDSVVAVDLETGMALAAREIGVGAGGMAIGPNGDVLYVARSVDGLADVVVVDIESGAVSAIPVSRAEGATIDAVRLNPAGTCLYAALTTAAGGVLVSLDLRTRRAQDIKVGATAGEIAVHGDDRRVFVTGWDADLGPALHLVDGRVINSVALDGLPVGLLAGGSVLYLAQGEHVTVVDSASLRTVNRVHTGTPVSSLAISRDGTRLYVGGYDGAITAMAAPELARGARAA